MLTIIEKVIFLQGIEAFGEIPTEQLSHIASITEEIEVLLLSAVSLDGEGDSDGYGGAGKHG